MPEKSRLLGTYRTPVLGADGLPVLQTPPGWRGLILERLSIPTLGECGPQFSGMPMVCTSKVATGRRWYRCKGVMREIPTPPMGMDVLCASYERDYEHWQCEPGCDTLCMRLHPTTIERYLQDGASRFDVDVKYAHKDDVLANSMFSLAEEFEGGLPNGMLYAEGLSLMIFGWLRRHYAVAPPAQPQKGGLSAVQQNRIREFIDSCLGDELCLEGMAEQLGMSPFHFLRQFRASFGLTPHQFVLKMRLSRAASLLRAESSRSISDIALATGFASQAHFTSSFKRHFGQTPAAWRASE